MANKLTVVRWTVEMAAGEFNLDRKTLANRIRREGIPPGDDGKYATSEICRVVFGDMEGEKLRLIREQADEVALRNAKGRGELVSIEAAIHFVGASGATYKQSVLASSMTEQEKDDCLLNLSKCFDAKFISDHLRSATR